jgi:RNA-directed DNA polymerase
VAKGKSITHYVKVKGEGSPFDGNTLYWASRMGRSLELSPSKIKLLRRCGCKCAWCHEWFQPGDRLEVDHIIPKSKGGKDSYTNFQLLHKHCHELKTAQDLLTPGATPYPIEYP